MDSLSPHVIFICGARGSGKSFTMGVIAEELCDKNENVGVILIDPVGVFWSMRAENRVEDELELLREWGLSPKGFDNVKVLVPEGATGKAPKETFDGTFSLDFSDLGADDWCLTFGIDRFDPAGLALDKAIRKAGDDYRLGELIDIISNDEEFGGKKKGFSSATRRGLVSRLEASKGWGILSDKGSSVEELSRPGQVTVLDVSFLDEDVTALVVGIIARKVLEERKAASRRESLGKTTSPIPPTWLLLDEAHSIVPNKRKTAATKSIVEYVKQGRKPGCSIVMATQQPSAIDSRVLSQLDILLCHKLVFYDDIKAVLRRFPSNIPKEMQGGGFIRTLPLGKAIVGDREESNRQAFVMEVRPRRSQHEGRSAITSEIKVSPKEKSEGKARKVKRIDMIRLKVSPAEAIRQVEDKLERFLFFFRREALVSRKLVYYPLWQARASFPIERENIVVYIDGLVGELVGKNKSKGILDLLDLNQAERRVLLSLNREKSLSQAALISMLDAGMAKRCVGKLTKDGLLFSQTKGGEIFYRSREEHRVPSLEELKRVNLKLENIPVDGFLVKPEMGFVDVEKVLSVLGRVVVKEARQVYYPYWVLRTSKGKRYAIDGVTGKLDEDVAKVIPSRL